MLWEHKFARNPVIPTRIFQQATNVAAFSLACFHAFVFISFDFFLPLYFQVILGLNPLVSGITLFALIIPLSAMPMVGGLIIRKTGNYTIPIYVGTVLMTLGNGLLIDLGTTREWAKIICIQVVTGIGAGMLFQSPMIALQSYLRQKDLAAAMSAYSFLRSLCTSISLVIGTVLLQQQAPNGSLTSLGKTSQGQDLDLETAKREYIQGLHVMWGFYTAVSGLMILAAVFIKQKPSIEKPDASSTALDSSPETEKAESTRQKT